MVLVIDEAEGVSEQVSRSFLHEADPEEVIIPLAMLTPDSGLQAARAFRSPHAWRMGARSPEIRRSLLDAFSLACSSVPNTLANSRR